MRSQAPKNSQPVVIAALYKFVTISDPPLLREQLLSVCRQHELLGTLLLAREGINGTVAGGRNGVVALIEWLTSRPEFVDIECKLSETESVPFYRMKVRLKKEIVTLGLPGIDPNEQVGTYVEPGDWNELISDPKVTLIDVRNRYEVHLGTFQGAVDPDTESFRDFPQWVSQNLDSSTDRKFAMFCTGGIRCEKATAYLLKLGYDQVFHLKGGILKYIETVPQEDSRWQGECFVFDNRVTVDHQLKAGNHEICFNCRMPVSESDKAGEHYEKHVSCARCIDRLTPERRESLLERARQVRLSDERHEQHIGRRFPGSEPST